MVYSVVVAVVVGDSREYMSACTATAKYLRKQLQQCDAVITATPQPTTKPIKLPNTHSNLVTYMDYYFYTHTYTCIIILIHPKRGGHPVTSFIVALQEVNKELLVAICGFFVQQV